MKNDIRRLLLVYNESDYKKLAKEKLKTKLTWEQFFMYKSVMANVSADK